MKRLNTLVLLAAMAAFGARLVEHGEDFEAAVAEARRLASAEGLECVPSFHPDLVRGVATYALELLRAVHLADKAKAYSRSLSGGMKRRLLLANAMTPLEGNRPLVDAIQRHAEAVFGERPPAVGTPLYTDVRLYVERGIPGVIYGAGPRTVLESHAKRADERLSESEREMRYLGRQ